MNQFDPFSLKTWPRFWRRVFIVTFPVSIPLWALFIIGFFAIAFPIGFAFALWEAIEPLWNEPDDTTGSGA